jgi:hypothetical protein
LSADNGLIISFQQTEVEISALNPSTIRMAEFQTEITPKAKNPEGISPTGFV